MAKVRNLDDAMDKYGKELDLDFFKLENDKDCEVVRFLHEGNELVAERDWFVVHEVEIGGKKRWVQCPEEDDCPLCGIGNKQQIKVFLQLVQKRDGKRKTWERGKQFVPIIKSLIQQYGDLCNRPYEIERNGVKNDRNTTYELFPLDRDDKTLADIPVDPQELLGGYGEGLVLQLSYEDMEDVASGRYRPARASSERDGRGDRGSDRGRDRDRGGSDRDRGGRGESDRSEGRREQSRERASERSSERGSDAGSSRRRERSGSEIF